MSETTTTTTSTMVTERVDVSKGLVKQCLENGMSKEEIRAQHYPGINPNQWGRAVKMMGLNQIRPKKVTFNVID